MIELFIGLVSCYGVTMAYFLVKQNKPTDLRLLKDKSDAQVELISIEKRDKNKHQILMKPETSQNEDYASLRTQFSEIFNDYESLSLSREALQVLLIEKELTIRLISGFVDRTQKTPHIINAPNFINKQTQGETNMADQSKNVNINNSSDIAGIVFGYNTGVVGKDMTGIAGGNISGTVTVSIGELAKSNIPEAPKMADRFKQLKTAIESENNLSKKDKTKALKQIQVLAEAGKNPQDEENKGLAETAVDILKGVLFMEIPSLSGIVEVFKELLPLIQAYFGL